MRQMMTLAAVLAGLLVGSGAVAAEKPAVGPKAEAKTHYLRLSRTPDKKPLALEAAIVRFARPADKTQRLTVDLVAALHVADKAFYDNLNKEFRNYDAVLYEMIAPKNFQVPKDGRSGSVVSKVQSGLTDLLDLEFQLKGIDYKAKNFVHADMSPRQFADSMKRRGETFFGMFLKMAASAATQQNGSEMSEWQLLAALFDKNRSMALKRTLAEQFAGADNLVGALDGPEGSTLLTQRNQVALDVLRKQLAAGKKKIAIFYGAGHMNDFQKRLDADFQFRPINTRWLVAWDLKDKPAKKKP